jgi:drug/metabolite transporter (DMT)-like permease
MNTHPSSKQPNQLPTGGAWRMALAMALSGTIGLLVIASGQTVWSVVWFRCLIGAAVLLTWLSVQRGWKPMNRRALAWLLAGAVALIANWLLLFTSFSLSGIAISTVVYHVQPFFLILLAALMLGEATQWHKMPWLVLALLGVALTTGLQWGGAVQADMLLGVAMALAAALLYAVATLATRKLSGIAPAQIAGLQLLLGASLLAPWADFSISTFTPTTWAALLTLGLVHTGLMYNLMYTAFQRLSAQRIAALSFIYPLVAIAVDLLVFDLVLQGAQLLGMGLILLAIVAHQRDWQIPWPRGRAAA